MLEELAESVKNTRKWINYLEEPKARFSYLILTAGEGSIPCIFGRRKVHFLFNLDASVVLRFSAHYARELAGQSHYLIYNPEADVQFELSCNDKTRLVWLSMELDYLHELFIHEPLPFLKPENVNRKYYEEKVTAPMLQMVLNQLFSVQLSEHAMSLFSRGKMLEILSLYFSTKTPDTEACPFLKDEEVVRKIKTAKDYLLQHMDNPPSLRQLARHCGLNEYQLKTGFKEIYGATVYGYLLSHKLDYARLLLDKGTLHVNEVAYQIGYSNPSHFIAAFKKKFGITPKKYLMSLRIRKSQ